MERGVGGGSAGGEIKVGMLRSAWGNLRVSVEAAQRRGGVGGSENLVPVLAALHFWSRATCVSGLPPVLGCSREWPGRGMEPGACTRGEGKFGEGTPGFLGKDLTPRPRPLSTARWCGSQPRCPTSCSSCSWSTASRCLAPLTASTPTCTSTSTA